MRYAGIMKFLRKLHAYCNKHEWIILLLILVLILRLPSFVMPHHYGDEEIYFVMGRAWKMGVPLYKAIFDHKPPLIYIMAGIAPTMFAFRGLLALFMMVHTVLFYNLAKLFWEKSRPKLVYLSSLLFVIITTLPTFEGLTVNAELLMMVPVTAAALILWKAKPTEWTKYLIAGLLGGLGWLFKIPVAADMVAIGLFFFAFKRSTFKESVLAFFSWSFVAYALAFVAPLALTFVYYYLKGSGPDYLATVLTVNLVYVSSWSTSSWSFNPFKSGLMVRGMALAIYTLGLYLGRKKLDKSFVFAALWFGWSFFGALLSGRPYPHYLQEAAAPAALLIPFVFVAENVISWVVIATIVAACAAIEWQVHFWGYPTLSVYKTYWQYVTKQIGWNEYLARFDNAPRNYEAAKYLNERLTPDKQIYIWGADSTIYNLTDRLPTGGKYIVSFHVHDLQKNDYVMENLDKNKPEYIVIIPGAEDFPQLYSLVETKYILTKELNDGTRIYLKLP
jgi:hypothetical protein